MGEIITGIVHLLCVPASSRVLIGVSYCLGERENERIVLTSGQKFMDFCVCAIT